MNYLWVKSSCLFCSFVYWSFFPDSEVLIILYCMPDILYIRTIEIKNDFIFPHRRLSLSSVSQTWWGADYLKNCSWVGLVSVSVLLSRLSLSLPLLPDMTTLSFWLRAKQGSIFLSLEYSGGFYNCPLEFWVWVFILLHYIAPDFGGDCQLFVVVSSL